MFHKWFIIAHHLKKWRTWSAQEPVLGKGSETPPGSPHRVVDEVGSAEKGENQKDHEAVQLGKDLDCMGTSASRCVRSGS